MTSIREQYKYAPDSVQSISRGRIFFPLLAEWIYERAFSEYWLHILYDGTEYFSIATIGNGAACSIR